MNVFLCDLYVPWSFAESMNSRKKGSSGYQSNPLLHRWITFLSSCLNEIITARMQETGLALKSTASKPMKTLEISQLWDKVSYSPNVITVSISITVLYPKVSIHQKGRK